MSQDSKHQITYCANRKCPYTTCLRHNINTPFNVMIKRTNYELDKSGNCKYRLEENNE